jgi:hypothetical protein
MFKKLLLILFFLFQVNVVYSEVYKWTDENGKTVYGDKPSGEDANIVDIREKPTSDQHYQERIKKRQKLLDVMQEERDEKIAQQKEEKEKKEKQEQQCARLKKELQETRDARIVYEETADPDNPKIYTDKERKAEEEKYEKYLKENC